MKEMQPKQNNQGYSGREISLTRKVLIWIFIISFWVFYYWYQGQRSPSRTQKSSQENPMKKDKQLSPLNSLTGGKSKPK